MYNLVHLTKGITEVIINIMQLKASSDFLQRRAVDILTGPKCFTLEEFYN